ncbi:MAG: BrnT family toxin, partial [Terriglobia bacterium]
MDEHHHIGGSDFVWDAEKAARNYRKHGIRFDDAATVFLDPLFVLTDASRN